MYPIVLNLCGKRVVVVGGGTVAMRKVKGLLACGADDIVVIAPQIAAEIPERVKHEARTFQDRDLDDAFLIFAATDRREVNDAIAKAAHARGILVNRADAEEDSDFATPAMAQYDELLVTVSSGGNPALSVKIRDLLSEAIDEKWKKLAKVSRRLRPQILSLSDAEKRKEILRWLASEEAAGLVMRGDNELVNALNRRFELSVTNQQSPC